MFIFSYFLRPIYNFTVSPFLPRLFLSIRSVQQLDHEICNNSEDLRTRIDSFMMARYHDGKLKSDVMGLKSTADVRMIFTPESGAHCISELWLIP